MTDGNQWGRLSRLLPTDIYSLNRLAAGECGGSAHADDGYEDNLTRGADGSMVCGA